MQHQNKFSDKDDALHRFDHADMPYIKTQGSFRSADGVTEIATISWEPPAGIELRGVIQLVHGMVEFVDRYDDFARFLVANGFAVIGHDHIAHGDSVPSPERWGKLPRHNGRSILVEDTHRMRMIAQERYTTAIPYFLFGHSMGSFVVRAYLMERGDGLAGAIISGTAQQPLALSRVASGLSHTIALVRGEDYYSALVDNLGLGAYNKAFEPARTSRDWLSRNEQSVDAYLAEPRCSFSFSVGGYITLTSLTGYIVQQNNVARAPVDLPLLFIGGGDDPVGDRGNGVRAAASQFRQAGNDHVCVEIYPEARHELVNEINRYEVYADMLDWMNAVLEKTPPKGNDRDAQYLER
jgi:alpha-beta hydrolase superfamily lysophospholipase